MRNVGGSELQGELSCEVNGRLTIAKMGIVEEEADEAIYWVALLIESGLIERERAASLLDEADQIVAIVVSSIRTARSNKS